MSDQGDIELQGRELTVRDYYRVLVRRKKAFILAFLGVFLATAVYTWQISPVYEAASTIHVGDQRTKNGKAGGIGEMAVPASIDAELEILLSRTNLEEVVRRLGLNAQVEKKKKATEIRISESVSSSSNPVYTIICTGSGSFDIKDAGGTKLASGTVGTPVESDSFRMMVAELAASPGDTFRVTILPPSAMASAMRGTIRAAEVGNHTGVIRVAYRSTNPVLARDVVNNLSQVYLEQSVALKAQESTKSLEFIEKQLKLVEVDLNKAEERLQQYKAATGVTSVDAETAQIVASGAEAQKELHGLDLQKQQILHNAATLKEAMKSGKPFAAPDDVGGGLQEKLADLEGQKRSLLTSFTPRHPQVVAVQRQIEDSQKALLTAYDAELRRISRMEGESAAAISRHERELSRLPQAERELAGLMRQVKVSTDLYLYLLQKYQEARITKASTTSNVNILDAAVTPQSPVLPDRRRTLMTGFLGGILAGILLLVFLEYVDDTVKDPETAKQLLGLPILAVIPSLPRDDHSGMRGRGSTLLSLHQPKSAMAEAFRGLRTSIHFSGVNKEKKVLLATSSFPGEGKSTLLSNLAVSLNQAGARVLLIDCDLRRPALHSIFQHSKVPGLTDILAGDLPVEKAVHNTGIAGLSVITAGTLPPNPAELLGAPAMASLMARLRLQYDLVLIDAPPVLAVTDPTVMAALSDMVLLVVETERVPRKALRQTMELLQTVRAPLAGIVFNDKSGRSVERYGYYTDSYYRLEAEPDRNLRGSTHWRLLLPISLAVAGLVYSYFFTGVFRHSPASQPVTVVRKPLPAPPASLATAGTPAGADSTAAPASPTPAAPAPAAVAAAVPAPAPAPSPAPVAAPQQSAPAAVPPTQRNSVSAPTSPPRKAKHRAAPAAAAASPPAAVVARAARPAAPAASAKPAPVVAKTPSRQTESSRAGKFTLLIGSYVVPDVMESDRARVGKVGLATATTPGKTKKVLFSRLLAGEFANPTEADSQLRKLKPLAGGAFVVHQGNTYKVYAGSYYLDSRARQEQGRLTSRGFKVTLTRAEMPVTLTRLTAGNFGTRSDAAREADRLRKLGLPAVVIDADSGS